MKSCHGTIKLTKGFYALNKARYHSKIERQAIIETWRQMYGDVIEGLYFNILPEFSKLNENKWSRRV